MRETNDKRTAALKTQMRETNDKRTAALKTLRYHFFHFFPPRIISSEILHFHLQRADEWSDFEKQHFS